MTELDGRITNPLHQPSLHRYTQRSTVLIGLDYRVCRRGCSRAARIVARLGSGDFPFPPTQGPLRRVWRNLFLRSGSHAKGNGPSSRLSVRTSGPVNFSVGGSSRSSGVRIFQIEVAACDDLHDSLHQTFQFATNRGLCSIRLHDSGVCRLDVHRGCENDSLGRLAGNFFLTYLVCVDV